MKNFKRAVGRKGTTTAAGNMNYLLNILSRETLREFDKLASQNAGTNNTHLKIIQEGLLSYLPPINALSKKKRAMCHAMRKNRDIPFKRFTAPLTELNNYLLLFPGSSATNNTPP